MSLNYDYNAIRVIREKLISIRTSKDGIDFIDECTILSLSIEKWTALSKDVFASVVLVDDWGYAIIIDPETIKKINGILKEA